METDYQFPMGRGRKCHGSWNAFAHARLFRTISRNLKLRSPELHHPNGGAISRAGGVGWQNVPMGPGQIGQARRPGCLHYKCKIYRI